MFVSFKLKSGVHIMPLRNFVVAYEMEGFQIFASLIGYLVLDIANLADKCG
jgi:hypothetical protein